MVIVTKNTRYRTNDVTITSNDVVFHQLNKPKPLIICPERTSLWIRQFVNVTENLKEDTMWKSKYTYIIFDESHKVLFDGSNNDFCKDAYVVIHYD